VVRIVRGSQEVVVLLPLWEVKQEQLEDFYNI
jgi:hypothetical protein